MNQRLSNYLKEQDASCKPSTVAGYQRILGKFFDYLKIDHIASLTKEDLRAYFLHLCAKPLLPYTKVNYLLAVKKYLTWEVEQQAISETLLHVLDRKHFPKVPQYLPRPLSFENDRLLQEKLRTSKSPYAPLFLLLRHSGMRISELISLPIDCVITTPQNEKYLKVPLGKMNNERLVPLTQEALTWIKTIKNTNLNTPSRKQDPNRLLKISGSVASVYRLLSARFNEILEDMTDGDKPITFHRLRHTYATALLTGGLSLASLMKLLGHRRIEMTLRYAKVTPSYLKNEYFKAIQALENQSKITATQNLNSISGLYEPAEIIDRLAAFVTKSSNLNLFQQKKLLKKLRRLQSELQQIHFSKKFKLQAS